MKKKGFKILITMCMVFAMLFGNILCVSAEENTDWWEDFKSKCAFNNSAEFEGVIEDINKYYDISYTYLETSAQVYGAVFVTDNTYAYPDYGTVYNAKVWLFSEEPFTCKGRSSNINDGEQDAEKEYANALDVYEFNYNGKTIYSTGYGEVVQRIRFSTLPVYKLTTDVSIYGASDLFKAIYSEDADVEEVYKPEDYGEYDKSLGYLHGLECNTLFTYGEDGMPTEAYYTFSWDKYYEEYDNSYEVEVYGVCNLERKAWFGMGESKLTNSERLYIKTVPYIERGQEKGIAEMTNTEMNAIFQSFWDVDRAIYETIAWNYDYYFRIVKDGKYGPWTIYDHKYGPLTGDDTGEVYVGEEDEEGNIIKDDDTDYGEGIEIDPGVGGGDSKEDALEDLIKDDEFEVADISDWFQWLYDTFKSLINSLGQFPQLIGKVFTFLPEPVIVLLCAVIVIAVVLRIVGR